MRPAFPHTLQTSAPGATGRTRPVDSSIRIGALVEYDQWHPESTLRHRTTTPGARRGVTLLEMLVAVALLVMMMLVLVSIFQSATGAISEMRSYQALDEELRRLDALIRSDLGGVTAKMTPPNNPLDGHGYFEYSENALSDAQGEDSDDTLRFTVKAPAGQPFVGRIWIPWSLSPANAGAYATPIAYNTTSQYAEVVYFLRNHNLYRRVFLISPQINGRSVIPKGVSNYPNDANATGIGFLTTIFPIAPTKLSAYSGSPYNLMAVPSIPTNTLGTSSAPGFLVSWLGLNDISAHPSPVTASSLVPTPNTLNDLTNRENRAFNPRFANDFYNFVAGTRQPRRHPRRFQPRRHRRLGPHALLEQLQQRPDPRANRRRRLISTDLRMVSNTDVSAFPYVYAYSTSQYVGGASLPYGTTHTLDPTITPGPNQNGHGPFYGTVLDPPFNHNPIDIGDSLAVNPNALQTWWGFPTWRETLSPNWVDPVNRVNVSGFQAAGISYANPVQLPPMNGTVNNVQLLNDGAGSYTFAMPQEVGEEDLVATNVRSFDIKALEQNPLIWNANSSSYQPLPAGYYDLGYANLDYALGYTPPEFLDTFAHEGRIPPLTTDFRADPQYPRYRPNLGDNNSGIIRMNRTWDSWSTDYTSVPGMPLYPENGPLNGLPSVMPSYPAPYPIPLRGMQIQIRVTDPENQHVKTLTIRQDFTDKL